jgi:TonB-linked SusC/RagA family outer membrane protein
MLLALALAAFGMEAQAQVTTGQVSGRVTHAQGGQPIVGAQVRVIGTNIGTVTDDAGQYTIRLVPPGDVTLRVTRIGFAEQTRTVASTAGMTANADFTLAPVAIQLAEVVTTATGEQRRVEVANAVTRIDAARAVEVGAIQNVGQVLATRAPGVQVQQGGLIGAGTRIRVRGTSSLSLSNEPIYIIDGVRAESGASSQSPNTVGGGTTPSRVNDINPEEIETIEVVRGPSAATLYGTDAANGVVVITTKRGRVGTPQVSLYGEEGIVTDNRDYPASYSAWGAVAPATTSSAGCFPARRVAGQCTRYDSLTVFNPAEDAQTTPFKDGHRRQYGAQLSGGITQIRYFLSAENEGIDGTYTIPKFDLDRYRTQGIEATDEWLNPNRYSRKAGRANLDLSLSPKFDVSVRSGFTQSYLRLPNTENSIVGLGFNMLNGLGRRTATGGYANFTPGDIFQRQSEQRINRFIASAAPIYRPFSWLTARGNAGLDFTSRVDELLCRASTCPNFSTTREGFKQNDRTAFFNYTVDGNVSASFDVMPGLNSRSTLGAQFLSQDVNRNGSGASRLTPGGTTTTQGAIPFADEATTISRTLGAFFEQQVSWQERLFVTGGLRADNSSAFGTDFGTVIYPKASVAYVLSDEPFFPELGFLNQLRLRTAYGASGVRPGTTDALPFYGSTSVAIGGSEQPGLFLSALGNLELKPERSTELEAGIDLTMFQNRANLEFTYYNKVSKDALVQRPLPPSLGAGTGTAAASVSRFENLGRIDNRGIEWLVQAQVVDMPMIGFDFTVNGSHNTNKLVNLGNDPRGNPIPPIVGATIQQRNGFPLNGYWQRPYTFNDANADGVIAASEIAVRDSFQFIGYSQPRLEMGITAGADFWNKQFRLQAVFDHKAGHYLYNNSERFRCGSSVCQDLVDPRSPLDRQARAVATRLLGINTGFFEKADYTRLRELSLTFRAPDQWAQRLRTRTLSATLSGQNLGLWTDYTGLDPESTYGQTDVPNDFLTQAPLSTYVFRVNVGF